VERWRPPPAPGQLDRPTQLKELNMKQFIAPMIVVLTSAVAASATAETIKYPPFSAYSMNRRGRDCIGAKRGTRSDIGARNRENPGHFRLHRRRRGR
jgi:hypothetical protein